MPMGLGFGVGTQFVQSAGGGGGGGGTTTNVTASLNLRSKSLLATGAALAALNSIPAGNSVTLTTSSGTPIELSYGPLYTELPDAKITPAAAWTGATGSGFNSWTEDGNARTAIPADDTRTTAKPVCQIMTPWNCAFTGKLYIPVYAEAKGGIQKVRAYAEGGYVDLTTRSHYRYTDPNGKEKWIHNVYVFCLDAADWTGVATDATRNVRMFFRAYANDGTMQTQLLGVGTQPNTIIRYNPRVVRHDSLVQVTPSAASSSKPGGAYPAVEAIFKTLQDALVYVRGNTADGITSPGKKTAPLIVITETAFLNLVTPGSSVNDIVGGVVVTTAPGVTATLGKTVYDPTPNVGNPGVAGYNWRAGVTGIEYRGAGIVWDYKNYQGPGPLQTGMAPNWLNGCVISNSGRDPQQYVYWDKNPVTNLNDSLQGFVTDCDIQCAPISFGLLALNNYLYRGWGDIFNWTNVVYGNVVNGWSSDAFTIWRPGFNVTYSGASATATISKAGTNGSAGNVTLAENGSTVLTVATSTYTTLKDLAAQINAYGNGWSATMDAAWVESDGINDRNTRFLATPTQSFGFSNVNAKGVTVQIGTYCDVHQDFWQGQNGTLLNKVCANNMLFGGSIIQTSFFDGTFQDCVFENNFMDSVPGGVKAQWTKAYSHLLFRNNSDPRIAAYFNNTAPEFSTDAYCTFEGNVFELLQWQNGATTPQYPLMTDNHFISGSNRTGGANVESGTTTGGTMSTLYPGWASMDIRPGAPLLAALIGKKTDYDALGTPVPVTTTKGAKAPAIVGPLTKAQALELAATPAVNQTGSGVGTATLSWKNGAGESGGTDSLAITFNVAA